MTIPTTALAITGVLGGGPGSSGFSIPKYEETLKKWLNRIADTLKRLAGKAVEALPAIMGSVVGAISSFLGKVVGSLAKHIWDLNTFVVEIIKVWVMQKYQVKKKGKGISKKIGMIQD